VVSWNVIFLKSGQGQKVLKLFQQEGVQPDPATYFGVLNACAVA
jgi:hypothetical protein